MLAIRNAQHSQILSCIMWSLTIFKYSSVFKKTLNWIICFLWPQAAVDFSVIYGPQGCHSAQWARESAGSTHSHLLSFPVLTGGLAISSGNVGHALLLGSAHHFHTPELKAPFLRCRSKHMAECSLGEALASNVSQVPSSPTFISLWKAALCLLEFVFPEKLFYLYFS